MQKEFEVQGLKELEQALLKMEAKTSLKVLRKAGRTAMKPVQEDMVAGANFNPRSESKHMRDDIKIKARKAGQRSTKTALTVTVGPHKDHKFKAIAQEFGSSRQSRAPFMRPALCNNAEAVLRVFRELLEQGVKQAQNNGS